MPKASSRKVVGGGQAAAVVKKPKTQAGRIMYIECKAGALQGERHASGG
ncbi:MAG TPA: hypothetical protein VGH19_15410 [Verrucomicrobiae bacterium]